MKQKLFTLIALVAMTMLPQFALADPTEVYSLTTTGALGTAGTATDTETPYTKGSASYAMNTLETNLWTAGATDEDPWTIKGVGQYIKVTVANNFDAGDQIVINGMGNGSFRIFDNAAASTSSDINAFEQAMSKTTAKDYTLTLAAGNPLIGKNTFYLRWSSGSNAGSLYYIKVNQDPTAPKYNISIDSNITNGMVEANATSARAGVEITLKATPEDGYELDALSVKQGSTDIEVNGNKFTMPAGNVTVSATFVAETVPANAIYNMKTQGDFGTQNEGGTFTKDGITYEKSSLNNTADTSHDPAWWRLASKTGYFGCILPTALQVGDQIVIAGKASSSSIKILLRNVNAVTVGEGDEATATEYIEVPTGTTEESEFTYTVTEGDILVGKSKFYIMQNSTNNLYFKFVRVLTTATVYDVTIADGITNGTVVASPAKTVEGTTVTLTVTPADGYELNTISAEQYTEDDSDIPTFAPKRAPGFASPITLTEVTEGTTYTFTMPNNNVLVTATFKKKDVPPTPAKAITITKQWTVFCSPETFAVPTGLKVYTVSKVTQPTATGGNGTVTLKQQSIIAEGVPMVLENTVLSTTTQFELTGTTGTIAATDQCSEFKGSATETTAMSSSNTNYVLKNGNFVRTTATQAAKYSCFLEFTSSSAPSFNITIDGNTTGISQIENGELRIENVYNLSGQRVAQPTKGLYIVNGKKAVIK